MKFTIFLLCDIFCFMEIIVISERENFLSELIAVWEDSVRSSHEFLSNAEIEKIKEYVPQAIKNIPILVVGFDNKIPIAFMGIDGKKLEMLFVKSNRRRQGIGKTLLNFAITNYGVNELCVNEENPDAIKFYEGMGFETYKRTELDEQGNSYPILYMKRK